MSKTACAISTTMENVVIQRVEMAVRPITGSPGQRLSSVVQNPDRRDFTGNTENTPFMLAFSRLDLNVDQDRNDETRNVENFEDGNFLALKPNYNRQAHGHHMHFFVSSPHFNTPPLNLSSCAKYRLHNGSTQELVNFSRSKNRLLRSGGLKFSFLLVV